MIEGKPLVVWVCDVPGWAYDKITNELSSRLPEFHHITFFVGGCGKTMRVRAKKVEKLADIIICFYPPWIQLFDDLSKVVVRLDGNRAFERYAKDKNTKC